MTERRTQCGKCGLPVTTNRDPDATLFGRSVKVLCEGCAAEAGLDTAKKITFGPSLLTPVKMELRLIGGPADGLKAEYEGPLPARVKLPCGERMAVYLPAGDSLHYRFSEYEEEGG